MPAMRLTMRFFEQDNPEHSGIERVRRDEVLSDRRGEVPLPRAGYASDGGSG